MDKNKPPSRKSDPTTEAKPGATPDLDDFYRKMQPEMRRSKPSPEAVAAAMEAAQRLAAEAGAEEAATDFTQDLGGDSTAGVCGVCGYRNRGGNKFCGMCGAAVESGTDSAFARGAGSAGEERRPRPIALHPNPFLDPEPEPQFESAPERLSAPNRRAVPGQETHHYHHHYHYFTGGPDGSVPRPGDSTRAEASGQERTRPMTAALRGDMSRAEAAVRRITQEWALACNTKHLDDLLDLYVADAMVMRSNYPPVRGAAAVREFFFGALDAGLGDVEIEPLRLEVAGDMAYEAGRCKALVPSATGKRREERGKYVWVCARQPNGEWKLAVDCWSSDLSLTSLESDAPPSGGVRSGPPRKS